MIETKLDPSLEELRSHLVGESIHYQANDSFHGNLTELFSRMREDIESKVIKTNEAAFDLYGDEIEKLINSRFNLNIKIARELSDVSPMAIIPFISDIINSLPIGDTDLKRALGVVKGISKEEKDKYSKIIRKVEEIIFTARSESRTINNKKGTIDLKRAVVSGYMAEVTHHLIMNPMLLMGEGILSPREMSAVVIHEIGHAFTGLESHYRMVSTNEAISDVLRSINDNEPDKVLYKFRTNFTPKELAEAALDENSTREDFCGALVMRYMERLESVYPSNRHDAVTFEYLADNFANRLGAGKDIVTALDSLNSKLNYSMHKGTFLVRMNLTLQLILYTLMILTTPNLMPLIALPIIMATTMLISDVMQAYIVDIYDNFKDRPDRIARDIAHILKDRSLPKRDKQNLINQYEIILETSKPFKNYSPIISRIVTFLSPTLRKDAYYKKLQQKIELTMNNPLFISTAKLDTVGGE